MEPSNAVANLELPAGGNLPSQSLNISSDVVPTIDAFVGRVEMFEV